MKCLTTVLSLFFVLLFAICAQAATFMADTFSYPDGQLTDSFLNPPTNTLPGANVSGGRWVAHAGADDVDNVDILNGAAELLASGREDVNQILGRTMTAGETWYYAAQVTVNDQRSNPNTVSINDEYFIHFKDSGFGFRARTWILDPNVASSTKFTLGISSGASDPANAWGTDLDFGTQYTLVAEYDFDSGDVRLWVDPANINSTSIVGPNLNANNSMNGIEALALRQDFIGGSAANNQILVDNVSAGDNFADVLAALGTDVNPLADADFDNDDDVDADDLALWQMAFGGPATAITGDANGDGAADGGDFLIWQRQFTGPPMLGASQVPEPLSITLLGLAMIVGSPFVRVRI